MVFGNLSTGYWLGAAAAAGLHWVELGRKTLTGTSDTIDVNPAWSASQGQSTVSGNTGSGSITFADNKCRIQSATYTDVYAYGLDMGVDITGDYCLDFEFTMNSNTYVSTGQACGWILGLSVANSAPTGENPSHANYEQTKFNSYVSGNPYVYVRSKNASGTNDVNSQEPVFTLNSSTAQTRYGRLIRDGTTLKVSVFSDSGRTTQLGSDVSTTTNASQNVRYLYIKQFTQNSSNTWDFDLDNIKLYNGQTSATGTVTKEITFSSMTAKPYMMVLEHIVGSGTVNAYNRLNGDTASNYGNRWNENGTENSGAPEDRMEGSFSFSSFTTGFKVWNMINLADQEKLRQGHWVYQNTAGAGTAPDRAEYAEKWANTSDLVTSVQGINNNSGDFAAGSEVVVLGYDPDDTEGTSVWEELTSKVITSNTASPVTTDTFTAKKYLWIQLEIRASTSPEFRVGTGGSIDTGSNYALRTASNGGTDETKINQVHLNTPTDKGFINMFVINKSDKEKLFIYELIDQNTAGAGNAPNRREYVGKWINTSGQIDVVQLYKSGATFNADTRIKVWGFD